MSGIHEPCLNGFQLRVFEQLVWTFQPKWQEISDHLSVSCQGTKNPENARDRRVV